MAGTVKEMSLIKQVLQLKQRGESNRRIARQLPINKGTVNGYMQVMDANGWQIGDLLKLDAEGRARITLYNNSRTTQIEVEAAGQAADGTLLWNK